MKQTEIERKERELKQAQKKEERLIKKSSCEDGMSVGDYIDHLSGLFFHDNNKIYNLTGDMKVSDCLKSIKNCIEEKHWDNIVRKAVKKTGITSRDPAIEELLKQLGSF